MRLDDVIDRLGEEITVMRVFLDREDWCKGKKRYKGGLKGCLGYVLKNVVPDDIEYEYRRNKWRANSILGLIKIIRILFRRRKERQKKEKMNDIKIVSKNEVQKKKNHQNKMVDYNTKKAKRTITSNSDVPQKLIKVLKGVEINTDWLRKNFSRATDSERFDGGADGLECEIKTDGIKKVIYKQPVIKKNMEKG